MKFIYALFSKDETGVDAVAFMCVVAMLTLVIAMGVPALWFAFANHTTWDGSGFATSALMIIGGAAGGKMARDNKFTNHPPQQPIDPPSA